MNIISKRRIFLRKFCNLLIKNFKLVSQILKKKRVLLYTERRKIFLSKIYSQDFLENNKKVKKICLVWKYSRIICLQLMKLIIFLGRMFILNSKKIIIWLSKLMKMINLNFLKRKINKMEGFLINIIKFLILKLKKIHKIRKLLLKFILKM